jgi:membrane associated rhomboid family serine protease
MGNEVRMGEFQILPPVVKNLLIINALFFLADVVFGFKGIDLSDWLGLHYFKASDFAIWQPVTYMFMHANFGHLFFNMFALWMFGAAIENYWGTKRFLIFYFVAGIGGALTYELWQYIDFTYVMHLQDYTGVKISNTQIYTVDEFMNNMTMVGASGAVYGLLLAFGMLFPNSLIFLYFLIPIKAKWFVIIFGGLEVLYCIFASSDGIAHIAHLGGMLFGLLLILYWKRRDKRRNPFYEYPFQ